MNKEQVLNYIQNNELDIQRSKATLINADLVWSSYVRAHNLLGIDFTPAFGYIEFKPVVFFYQINVKKNINKIAQDTYESYLKNQKDIYKVINARALLQKKVDAVWWDYKNGKLKDIDFLNKYEVLCRDWWIFSLVGEDKGDIINREIIPKFAKAHNLSIETAVHYIGILSHPSEQSCLSEERTAFLEICLDFIKNKNLDRKINFYIKKFFWFKTDFYQATEITKESIMKEINLEINKKNQQEIEEEIRTINDNFADTEKQKKELKGKIKLTKQDIKDIEFSKMFVYQLDVRKLQMMTQFYYLLAFAKDISLKKRVSYQDLSPYTFSEFKKFVAENKRLSKTELENRKVGVFLVYEKDVDKVKFFYGDEWEKLLEIIVNTGSQGEIKGQVASRGRNATVRGVVNIVLDPSHEKFKEGSVLVTSMTRVEFVPLMRKAKAIITNEGGIACHAAIVSRELGIPCIIGTKNATKILKDGDKVELDLEKGIVKIIN